MPIFDQGYQHWSGELTSHTWRWLAITRHGIRIGMKNRLLRIILLFAWLPAIVLAFSLCLWGLVEQKSDLVAPLMGIVEMFLDPQVIADPKSYRVEIWTLCYDYFLLTELRFSMVLVLLVGPSLISRDLRFNAMPLYFSRPVRRIDYFLGKLGVVAYFLGMVLIVPSIIAYILGIVFSLDLSIIPDTFRILLASVGYGIVMCLSAGLLILALSSLSRNSRYVGLFWLGVWFVSSIVGTVLEGVNREHHMHQSYRKAMEAEQAARAAPPAKNPEENRRRQQAQANSFRTAWDQAQREAREEAKSDWRPLVSYTANLSRIGQRWLRTDACWERLSQNIPEDERERYLFEKLGTQYPWYWSAIVLLILFGLSACILNFRVKSLDRLK